jgi:hypothetical protein
MAPLVWLASASLAVAQAPGDRPPQDQARQARPPLVEARAMTLHDMTEAADKIFQGTVKKVTTEDVELKGKGGKSVKVKAQVVTFDVTRKIKGDVEVGKPLEVRQIPTARVPLQEGEEVLWYLAKPGRTGFTAPLGVYSGHFKVRPDPEQPEAKVATNLLDNKGLWSTTAPLVQPEGRLARKEFANNLDKKAGLPRGRAAQILAVASQPSRPGPLPLELVTSATESLLNTQP